jgi:L-fuculose-phosphate aldolase
MTKPLHEIKRHLVRVCHRIDQREYVGGRDGNVSVRVSETTILVTPAGVRKGDVDVDGLVLVDREGRGIEGRGRASSELGMHLRIYDLRPDVRSVVHAHPPVATGFAAAGVELSDCVLPEVIVGLGRVPIARYATPGTPELSTSLDPVIADHDAYLLENHGVVTVGETVDEAHQRMETVEHAARILLVARLLGGANPLSPENVAALVASRRRYGVREGLAVCDVPARDDDLVEEIARRVLARLELSGDEAH